MKTLQKKGREYSASEMYCINLLLSGSHRTRWNRIAVVGLVVTGSGPQSVRSMRTSGAFVQPAQLADLGDQHLRFAVDQFCQTLQAVGILEGTGCELRHDAVNRRRIGCWSTLKRFFPPIGQSDGVSEVDVPPDSRMMRCRDGEKRVASSRANAA